MSTDAAEVWEARYAQRAQVWSGEPNRALVDTVTELAPGRALDLGCGEGADAVWLARHGWRVTALDVSSTAVARGRELAATRSVGDTIRWRVQDLADWRPDETYELVSACFLHSPVTLARGTILRRAAAAVTSGGHLLIVGHAQPPPWATAHHHHAHDFLGPDAELHALELTAGAWETQVAEVRSRPATGPDGSDATLQDSVLLLRHR